MSNPALHDCRHAESERRSESQNRHSRVGRISLFGRNLPVVVVLAVLALPAIGAFLGANAGAGSVVAVVEFVAEFGALIGAVGSNLQALVAQVGTGPSVGAVSATVLAAEKITE